MNIENIAGFTLTNIGKISVILGKNGCGKSHLMKAIEQTIQGQNGFGNIRYISPERGGAIVYEAGVDQAIFNNQGWMNENRRKNQSENFRQQSAALFRQLELVTLRIIEKDHRRPGYVTKTFDDVVEKINTLLDRIKIERSTSRIFLIKDIETGASYLHPVLAAESQRSFLWELNFWHSSPRRKVV
ncbi:hypothetical protein ACVDG8_028855 [Mesorhizobium sp. ORM8.1]